MVVTIDDTARRVIRSTLPTLPGFHPTAVVPIAHLRGLVVPTGQFNAIPRPTYPSVVLEAFLMHMNRTTLPNVERWMIVISISYPLAVALLAQIRIFHKNRLRPRRHHGLREPQMTSVVCQACPISLSLHLSSHSCASGISRTAPKRTIAFTKPSFQGSVGYDLSTTTTFWPQ